MGVNWADDIFWLNVRKNIPNREDDYYTVEKTPPRELMEVSFLQSFKTELGNTQEERYCRKQPSPWWKIFFLIWPIPSFSSLISVSLWIWMEENRPRMARRETSVRHWFSSLLASLFLAIHNCFHHLQMARGAGGNTQLQINLYYCCSSLELHSNST